MSTRSAGVGDLLKLIFVLVATSVSYIKDFYANIPTRKKTY